MVLDLLIVIGFYLRASADAEKATPGSSTSAVSASLPLEVHTMALKKESLSSSGGAAGDENEMRKTMKVSSPGNKSGRRRGRRGGMDFGGRGGGGGMSMEGSRCSRVNGRGWRCSQQTLVGYALCEHHLGKGRLGSITNVRRRPKISGTEASGKEYDKQEAMHPPTEGNPEQLLPSGLKEGSTVLYDNEEEDDEEEDDSAAHGKKKARSMKSLLEQGPNNSNNSGVAAASPVVEGRDLQT